MAYWLKLLPDLDSNQDKQNQNLLCYRYTIGQWSANIKTIRQRIKTWLSIYFFLHTSQFFIKKKASQKKSNRYSFICTTSKNKTWAFRIR